MFAKEKQRQRKWKSGGDTENSKTKRTKSLVTVSISESRTKTDCQPHFAPKSVFVFLVYPQFVNWFEVILISIEPSVSFLNRNCSLLFVTIPEHIAYLHLLFHF